MAALARKALFAAFLIASVQICTAQSSSDDVNVFLGSSGDHGQLSPAASYPFGLLSIAPQTYPKLHTGYEHKARTFLGFTHNRVEGVGCMGSGGNILITPFISDPSPLIKTTEKASPGSYSVAFTNGINAAFVVNGNGGLEDYHFPETTSKGFKIDLSHTLANRFVAEEHTSAHNSISGWIDSKTTCNAGTYRVYYYITFDKPVNISDAGDHSLSVVIENPITAIQLKIAFSSVDIAHAQKNILTTSATVARQQTKADWSRELDKLKVRGSRDEEKKFYSFLYRTIQSPFLVSEKDGSYRATDGSLQQSNTPVYNGWAIWDNYRTQLPLLALLDPARYQSIINSIAALYKYGKKDYATQNEPSNTVRTEHAIVVLLDAYRKGFHVDFKSIRDSLIAETDKLDFTHPDKALESSYDTWALSQILEITGDKQLSDRYKAKAAQWRAYWTKDFKDLTKNDIDKVGARGMYQGTIWQYRWLVTFDFKGLIEETGGETTYLKELDAFFQNDYYNHANETDIQAPLMYNFTSQPWKSQDMVRKYAADTVVQYYFNDNSRGIDPFVGRIYENKPDTYVRTMDDDAGAMSAWYVLAATGLMPACVGWPVYYLSVPLFEEVRIVNGKNPFIIQTKKPFAGNRYIQSVTLNGKALLRNWISHEEIAKGGTLVIVAGDRPNKNWGVKDQWITEIK
ncbi:glycoside hydrolase family 92 protein [Terrimonas sp. NA20]|uniref:Glycoside hydrolase family 92 protein n=1 Tax=Terrimonas ginsenosidimutans TaxID=2908004 RepID=A0ABS9KWP2_9BACT|nr:glycoside hydrolase domain-containing protein [Terrimonas ginsenosidimutans]MCG2616733.1 glycoside hydrolase family 92 protein [Terrimonas ginsenosidimutans]